MTHTSTLAQLTRHIEWNLEQLGLLHHAGEYRQLVLHDESPEICLRRDLSELPYGKLALITVGLCLMFALLFAILRRMCRRSPSHQGSHHLEEDY